MIIKIKRPDCELEVDQSREILTDSGWEITPWLDRKGNEYERAEKDNRVQWFKVIGESRGSSIQFYSHHIPLLKDVEKLEKNARKQ